jgi:hypothetical protein
MLSSDRSVPQGMAAQFLPGLLALASNLLQATPAPAAPENVAKVLRLILKVYRLSITNDLSPHHQDIQGSLIPWGSLFLQIVARQLDRRTKKPESAASGGKSRSGHTSI